AKAPGAAEPIRRGKSAPPKPYARLRTKTARLRESVRRAARPLPSATLSGLGSCAARDGCRSGRARRCASRNSCASDRRRAASWGDYRQAAPRAARLAPVANKRRRREVQQRSISRGTALARPPGVKRRLSATADETTPDGCRTRSKYKGASAHRI